MSLIRHAVRVATVKALLGRTRFGETVLDSQNGTLDLDGDGKVVTNQSKPFIAVYTYDGKIEKSGDRDLHGGGVFDLAIELGYVSGNARRNVDGERVIDEGLADLDGNREFLLELVSAEIRKAMVDPDNTWSEIWRGLVSAIYEETILATRHATGQRVSGHQILLTVGCVRQPIPGEPIVGDSIYGRFLAALEGSGLAEDHHQAELIRGVLGEPDPADWRQLQRRRGMTAQGLRALGHGPLAGQTEAPEATEAVLQVNGRPETVTRR